MLVNSLILVAGIIALIVGADQLVKGASSVAKRYGVSNLVIGLTIVAFGSSAPELVVNVFAALRGASELALGNIMGSNIANVFLILGVSALIRPLVVERVAVRREIPFAVLGMGMVLALGADQFFGNGVNVVSRGEGIALLGFFAIFLYFTFLSVLQSRSEDEVGQTVAKYPWWQATAMVVGGLIGLLVGGQLIVDSATFIASTLGVSDALIALTVIAIGTSLPELAASGMAAYRGHTDMAIGNIVGSIIFNTLWIVGISALILPLPVHAGGVVDMLIALGATLFLFLAMVNGKKIGQLTRSEGVVYLVLYVAFLVFSVWRG